MLELKNIKHWEEASSLKLAPIHMNKKIMKIRNKYAKLFHQNQIAYKTVVNGIMDQL